MRGTAAENDGLLQSVMETQKVIQRQLASLQKIVQCRPVNNDGMGTESRPRSERSGIVCHHCQRPGHKRPDCPDLPPRQGSGHHATGSGRPSTDNRGRWTSAAPSASTVQTIGQTLYLHVRIGKAKYKGLLDSGSEVTLLPAKAAQGYILQPTYRVLRAANGTEINVLGALRIDIKVGKLRLDTEFIVSDQIEEILLGMDWMDRHQCILECGSKILTIQDVRFELKKKSTNGICHKVVSSSDVDIPARTEAVVSGKVVYSNLNQPNPALWTTESRECLKGLQAARGLVELRFGP